MKQKNTTIPTEQQFSVRLMRNLVVPTFVLDAEGNVLIWNKACERLTGVKAEKIIGTRDHWQAFYDEPRDCLADLLVKGDTDKIKALYCTSSNSDDDHFGVRVENWCEVPNMEGQFYLAIDAGPIYNDSGDLIAVVETLRDMTEQKLAQDKLERLAQKDGLTGIANRRAFDYKLKGDWSTAQRNQTPIALLFIDIDHFKQFNDIYGHQGGDDCLKTVAKVIAEQSLRPSDLPARYGGEEFTIILPGVNLENAKHVAERIRKAIYDLNWKHSGNSATQRVTISIGVASLIPTDEQQPDTLIENADKALYQAKSSGRNKVADSDPNKVPS